MFVSTYNVQYIILWPYFGACMYSFLLCQFILKKYKETNFLPFLYWSTYNLQFLQMSKFIAPKFRPTLLKNAEAESYICYSGVVQIARSLFLVKRKTPEKIITLC